VSSRCVYVDEMQLCLAASSRRSRNILRFIVTFLEVSLASFLSATLIARRMLIVIDIYYFLKNVSNLSLLLYAANAVISAAKASKILAIPSRFFP